MPVRYIYKKEHKSEIPAALQPFYIERGDELVLDCEGAASVEQLNEFRNNNREMIRLLGPNVKDHTQAIARLTLLKDIDIDQLAANETELKNFREGKAPKLDELVTARVAEMKKSFEKKETDMNTALQAAQARLSKVLIDDAIVVTASKKGVLPSALEDVKNRGRAVFKLEDNERVVCFGADNKPRYGKNSDPMTIDEWMDELATQAGHLFSPNKGAGGQGGSGKTGGYAGPNPYSAKTRNLTKQAQLERENPTLAKQLQAQAE